MSVTEAAALGATLYVPATRDDLASVLFSGRNRDLRSAVVCLEDSVREDAVAAAFARLRTLLAQFIDAPDTRPAVFIRPRGPEMLRRIVDLPGIEGVQGFVIPKATADVLPAYLDALQDDRHAIMPTLESREVFDPAQVRRLRDQLLAVQHRVLCLRIGGNDLLQLLGARRSTRRTAYDGPLGAVISNLLGAFAPYGFALSAPMLETFGDPGLLREEVERDLEHGLMTKTAIHPSQITTIQDCYAVSSIEHATALAVLDENAHAVYAIDKVMSEPATHQVWARGVLSRAAAFGVACDGTQAPSTPSIAPSGPRRAGDHDGSCESGFPHRLV